jgi:hypothetical protein
MNALSLGGKPGSDLLCCERSGAGEWVDASQVWVRMMPDCQPAGSVTGDFGLSGVIPCQLSEGQVGHRQRRDRHR